MLYHPFHLLRFSFAALLIVAAVRAEGQFAPVVGYPGTTAIAADSAVISAWATGCSLHRGYRDIAVPDSGYASVGDSSSAIGPARQNGVVSLGDGGSATLTFARPIVNGSGFDFAVFENGFSAGGPGMAFLELAFVEVSSDGQRFVRFPSTDNVQDTLQLPQNPMDGSLLNNLAGKYVFGYGTPFDLDELRDSAGLDINSITAVRIIDVVGSIDPMHATRDSRGRIINDPYPTNFGSSGFDLDAVGVIHQKAGTAIEEVILDSFDLYPNPAMDKLHLSVEKTVEAIYSIFDLSGRELTNGGFDQKATVDIHTMPAGIYFVRISTKETIYTKIFVKQ